jgi:23S rRNA (adenine2030-N6)-methyltransferase
MLDTNQIALHQQDAYLAMKAFLPFKQKRGLVLIDPPFEQENEYQAITNALQQATRCFAHGMYAIWYPIKHRSPVNTFHAAVKKLGLPKVLVAELFIRDDDNAATLNGCGMLFINPPWQLDTLLQQHLPWLAQLLRQGAGARSHVEWLG